MGNEWGTKLWDDKLNDKFALELSYTLDTNNNQTLLYKDIFW